MTNKTGLYLVLAVALALAVFSVAAGCALAQTPEPAAATGTLEGETQGADPSTEQAVLDERTPETTATPDAITRGISEMVARAGLARARFLRLTVEQWITLGISALIVVIAYLIGTLVIRGVLPRVVRRTQTELDDRYLETAGPGARWLVVVITLHFATQRLAFLGANLKELLSAVYFVAGTVIAFRLVWEGIDVSYGLAHERLTAQRRADELDPVLMLGVRLGRILVALVAIVILLSFFGINVAALTTAMGVAGLAFSLAAQDTLSDAISGFIILADRPFRVGDRIEIRSVGTWGDVVEIGLRTTRIRTRDNRMVVVPNSVIGKNEVVNFTYPDPHYRIETHVTVPYDTDVEMIRRLFVDAVRGVEGVLPNQPVDALYIEMADSAMVFRLRWWIQSYVDTRRMVDRVHTAVQAALNAARIKDAYPTQNLNLQIESEMAERLSHAFLRPDEGPTGD